MFAGFGAGNGQWCVCRVKSAVVHRIYIGLAQHLVEVRVDGFNSSFLRKGPGAILNEVANRCDLHPIRMFQVGRQVRIGNTSGP